LRLIFSTHRSKHPPRDDELQTCMRSNLESSLFDSVECLSSEERPTFKDLFDHCWSGVVNVVANADITFDATIELARSIPTGSVYALTPVRVDGVKHSSPHRSQDTWIFRGIPSGVQADFQIGIPWCDNRIAFEFTKAGYLVSNPSKTILTTHHHCSNYRTYQFNKYPAPANYLFVPQQTLEGLP